MAAILSEPLVLSMHRKKILLPNWLCKNTLQNYQPQRQETLLSESSLDWFLFNFLFLQKDYIFSFLFCSTLEMISARNRSPFTPTQWQELEHQALIFKYMVSGVPIPPELIYSVKRSLDSSLASRLFPHQPSKCAETNWIVLFIMPSDFGLLLAQIFI